MVPAYRPTRVDAAFLGSACVAFALILYLGRGLTFLTFGDDWAFVLQRSLADPATWFPAHNEHWSTIPVLLFRLIFERVGLKTYLPYLVVLVSLHMWVVSGVYLLARGRTHAIVAFALTLPLLVFGAGWENLLISFQASTLLALGFGIWSILALRAGRPVAVGILLVLAEMSAGAGLFFVPWILGSAFVRKDRWTIVAALSAIAIYGAWALVFPPQGIAGEDTTLGLNLAIGGSQYVAAELVASMGALVAGGPWIAGGIATVGLAAWVVLAARRNPAILRDPDVIGAALAIAAGLVMVALARRQQGLISAGSPRYVYTVAVFLVPLIAAFVGRPRMDLTPRQRAWLAGAAAALLIISLTGNLRALLAGGEMAQLRSDVVRSVIALELGPDGATLPQDRSVFHVPPRACMAAIAARYGTPGLAPPPSPTMADAVRRAALEGDDSLLPTTRQPCDPTEWPGLR